MEKHIKTRIPDSCIEGPQGTYKKLNTEPKGAFVIFGKYGKYIEYLLDLLTEGSTEDKAGIVIDHGKGVKELERRMAEFKRADAERYHKTFSFIMEEP